MNCSAAKALLARQACAVILINEAARNARLNHGGRHRDVDLPGRSSGVNTAHRFDASGEPIDTALGVAAIQLPITRRVAEATPFGISKDYL